MKIKELVSRPATFKERLKTVMEIRNITQAQLARATGLSKGGISNYISGRYEPKTEIVSRLAAELECSEYWLRGYDVPMHRKQNEAEQGEDPLRAEISSYLDTLTREETEQLLRRLKDVDQSSRAVLKSFLITPMNEKESRLLFAYRTQPEMQCAVDKLLSIEEGSEKALLYSAANSDDNHKPKITKMPSNKWETIVTTGETDADLL